MKLTYGVADKPHFGKVLVFALQQLLAILAATIAVPAIINSNEGIAGVLGNTYMSTSAALFGAGVGTIVYLLFTKFKSPVFLGSSFAFIGSMLAAFAGATSAAAGFAGIILGAFFAGLVYVVISIIVKAVGVNWVNKLMPAVVIGPTVAIIGLSLAGNAVGDVLGSGKTTSTYVCIVCGLVTLFVTMICSVFGKKMLKMIPFIIGICAGYIVAAIFTVIGKSTGNEALMVINFAAFENMKWVPEFTFVTAFKGLSEITPAYVGTVAAAYVPVAFVVFAEHIADHKNLSSIIESDLLEEPGLHRTLLGDGVGSMVGAFFGGCPNTTYGESVGCVAISGNASVVTILTTAIIAIIASFFGPFVTILATIPSCVMGGVCVALYGFIAVSGLKMIQKVDLDDNANLFTVSVILIAGIGGFAVSFGSVTITEVACALILGIITNKVLGLKKKK
ncbi:MAG: uracil-xanthine permease [Lachnospiraceae bacterium]|nr:uracil-xanthine permease [Lachnospiraceae bacterium]